MYTLHRAGLCAHTLNIGILSCFLFVPKFVLCHFISYFFDAKFTAQGKLFAEMCTRNFHPPKACTTRYLNYTTA